MALDLPGSRPAAWLLVTDLRASAVRALAASYGTLHRIGLPETADPDVGAPCFLVGADAAHVPGLWAVGGIVAPTLEIPSGTPLLPGEVGLTDDPAAPRRWAEVELLLLEKPVRVDALAADGALATLELPRLVAARQPAARPLTGAQVRALEAFDLWLVEPTTEQRAALETMLDADEAQLP